MSSNLRVWTKVINGEDKRPLKLLMTAWVKAVKTVNNSSVNGFKGLYASVH